MNGRIKSVCERNNIYPKFTFVGSYITSHVTANEDLVHMWTSGHRTRLWVNGNQTREWTEVNKADVWMCNSSHVNCLPTDA